jgi:hypothetical protein
VPAALRILVNANLFGRSDLVAISNTWSSTTPGAKDNTRVIETRRRHAIENRDKDLATVQALEMRMGVTERWIRGSAESHEAARLLHMRKYQRALDVLEGLVVARVFELNKMNRSQTGIPAPTLFVPTKCLMNGVLRLSSSQTHRPSLTKTLVGDSNSS